MVQLSIIVPTRCRVDTLQHTLRTILNQDFDSFEVIVSDNHSDDGTGQYVNSIEDSRLKYINTNRRISMSDNWEFALSHCSGKYVTVIGDDDGFIPGGIRVAVNHIERSGLSALIWEKAEYCWPDHIVSSYRNRCTMRVAGFEHAVLNSKKVLRSVCEFKTGYNRLPCLYTGMVSRDLLNELVRSSKVGKLFLGICPDVLSSIVVGSAIAKYAYLKYPVSVNGASRHSNGTSSMRSNRKQKGEAASMFLKEQQIAYPDEVQWGPSPTICTLGEQLLAQSAFPSLPIPNANYSLYLRALAKECMTSQQHEAIFESAQHTGQRLNLTVPSYVPPAVVDEKPATPGVRKGLLNCHFADDVVHNIYDACQVVGSIVLPAANIQNGVLSNTAVTSRIVARLKRTYDKTYRHVQMAFPNFASNQRKAA